MFQENLDLVRGSLMGPLATASLELGSYQRGYEYIARCVFEHAKYPLALLCFVRLHMLQEVDEIVTKFVFGPEDQPVCALESMLTNWNNRLKLTQVNLIDIAHANILFIVYRSHSKLKCQFSICDEYCWN